MARKKTSRRKSRHETEHGSFAGRACAVNARLRSINSCLTKFNRRTLAHRDLVFRATDRAGAGAILVGDDAAFAERRRSHRAEKQSSDFCSTTQPTGFRTGNAGSALKSVAASLRQRDGG